MRLSRTAAVYDYAFTAFYGRADTPSFAVYIGECRSRNPVSARASIRVQLRQLHGLGWPRRIVLSPGQFAKEIKPTKLDYYTKA